MKKNILVIDDSIATRFVVTSALKSNDYDVIEVSNGKEGIDALKNGKKRFDLAICDYNMPIMDGPDFVRNARLLPDYRFLKILMVTNETNLDRKNKAKESGATAWMQKPFKTEALLNAIKKFT